MRIIKLKVQQSKAITISSQFIGNKGDNNSTKIKIECDDSLLQNNNFLILENPTKTKTYCCPLLEMEFIVTSSITLEPGAWTLTFVSTTQEDVTSENLDYDNAIMVSDCCVVNVNDSCITNELETLPVDENMKLIYEDLLTLYNELSTIIEDTPNIKDYIEIQEELAKIEKMIENISLNVEVDNTEVLAAIDGIATLIKGISVDVDLTPVLNELAAMSTLIKAIPTIDYTSEFKAIKDEISAISVDVDLTPILSKLDELDTIASAIPTLTYTSELNAISKDIKAIPTIDYTNELNTIKSDISKIPTTTYTDTLASIIKGIDELKASISTLSIEVDLTPILTKLDTIESELGTIKENIATMLQMVGITYNNVVDVKSQLESNQSNFNRIQGIETSTQNIERTLNVVDTKLGSYDGSTPPADKTLWHDAYWALVRAEQANSNAEDIRDLKGGKLASEVTSVQSKLDEILEKVNNGGSGGGTSSEWDDPMPYMQSVSLACNDASKKFSLDISSVSGVNLSGCICDTIELKGTKEDLIISGGNCFSNTTLNVLNFNGVTRLSKQYTLAFAMHNIKEILNLNMDYAEDGGAFSFVMPNTTLTRVTFSGSFGNNSTVDDLVLDFSNQMAMNASSFEELGNSIVENTSGLTRAIKVTSSVYNEMTDAQKLIFINKNYGIGTN